MATLSMTAAFANESPATAGQGIRLSGFGTLGLTYHDNEGAAPITAFSQKAPAWSGVSGNLDSVLGLQLDWQALKSTSVVLQAVTRPGDNFDPALRMAYVRQQVGEDFSARLGRIRSPLYFDSGVTEIGYANLTARPPGALYFLANNVPTVDGGDIQWRKSFGNTGLLVQAYTGGGTYKAKFWDLNIIGDTKQSDLNGLAVSLTWPSLTLRASHSKIASLQVRASHLDQLNQGLQQVSGTLNMLASNPMLPAGTRASLSERASKVAGFVNPSDMKNTGYTSLGFSSVIDPGWTLLGEVVSMSPQSSVGWGKFKGYQFTGGRAFGDFTPYLGFARLKRTTGDPDTSALSPTGLSAELDGAMALLRDGVNRAASGVNLSSQSWTAGVRWDFRRDASLKFQYDHLKSMGPTMRGIYAAKALPIDPKVQLLTVTMDFLF